MLTLRRPFCVYPRKGRHWTIEALGVDIVPKVGATNVRVENRGSRSPSGACVNNSICRQIRKYSGVRKTKIQQELQTNMQSKCALMSVFHIPYSVKPSRRLKALLLAFVCLDMASKYATKPVRLQALSEMLACVLCALGFSLRMSKSKSLFSQIAPFIRRHGSCF